MAFLSAWSSPAAERGLTPEGGLDGIDGRFIYRMWETAEGILPTTVRSIAQTPDGYVWLSSHDSMVRFDGVRAVTFNGKRSLPLPSPLRGLETFSESSGRLWCSTLGGGLFAFENDQWIEFGEAHGWTPAPASNFSESPTGEIAFIAGGKLMTYGKGLFKAIPLPAGQNSPVLSALYSRDGALWAGFGNKTWRHHAARWEKVPNAPASYTLARSGAEGIWLATPTEFQQYSADGLQKTIARGNDFQNDSVRLLEDAGGNLWAGGLQTGLRIWAADGAFFTPGSANGVLSPQISCLFEDREMNVLVGTTGAGLARFKPANFRILLGGPGSLTGSLINSVASVGDERILVGTEGNGLYLIENGIERAQITSKDGQLGEKQRVTSIITLDSGKALAAVASKGIFRIEGTEATALPGPPEVAKLVRSMLRDKDGVVWIGCESGVFRWKDDAFAPLAAQGMPAFKDVRGIAQTADGTLWFVHDGGLASMKSGTVEPFQNKALQGTILAVSAGADGVLWLGIENKGLARIEDGKVFLYTNEHGLPSGSIGSIAIAGNDVWLATEKGLARYSRPNLDAVLAAQTKRLQYRFFNRGDGLGSDLFRRGYQPAFAKDDAGTLWFATHKGLAGIHPSRLLKPAYEVPAIIEEIRAERELIVVTKANRDNITIPLGTKHITFRCAVPSLSKPEFMPIEYRIEGHDPRWYSTGTERVIRLYDLAPGSYRFVVRAIGADGKSVEPSTSVAFKLLPFYWQTLWFRIAAILAVAGIAAFAVWQMMRFRLRIQEERLREQEERAQLESQLQQASQVEAIGRLAGGIAHDFNNVLTSILGNAELAHMEFGENPKLKPLLDDIINAGGRARDLVVQILTYSRKRPASLTPIDIGPSVREALALLRSGIPATVTLESKLPSELPLVLADGSQIQRVIVNLCTNASHALGASGGRIAVRATEFTADAAFCAKLPRMHVGRYVRINVEDNGTGMDDKTLKHIFDPFFTTKGVGKGTGLGLAVVQGIVEAHGGFISVDSRVYEGTTFSIFLPVTDTAAQDTPITKSIIVGGNKERILVIDDEPAVLNIARRYLELLDYTVDEFTDPVLALEAFSAKPGRYHLVFTDFAMPGMNGVDLAQRIRSIRKDIPIILCTGFGGAVNEDAARLVGITQVVNKPYQKQTVADAISAAMKAHAKASGGGNS